MTSELAKELYLNEMGLSTWYPRVRFTNSLEPIVFKPRQEHEGVLSHIESDQQLLSPASPEERLKPISHAPIHSNTEPEPIQAPQHVEAGEPATDVIHFGLGIYIFGDYLIISSLVNGHEHYQDTALTLVRNIVKAISTKPMDIAHHHIISWPFFANTNADQGKEAAKKYVDSVIEHIKEKFEFNNIIVFGGVMPKLNDWRTPNGTAYGVNRVVLPSVYRMLDDPSMKAKAWALLKNHL